MMDGDDGDGDGDGDGDRDLKVLPPATSAQASPGSKLSISVVRACLFTLMGEEQKPVGAHPSPECELSQAALMCSQLSKASQPSPQDTLAGYHITPPLLALKNTPLANIISGSLKSSMSSTQEQVFRRVRRGDQMPVSTFLEEVLVAGSGEETPDLTRGMSREA
ncbi:hypothetical protein llap_6586 [Limosa lapponica baueri]|uniref:Uncharacterized protein n=1 Tax=Limosa lapponica baueri TaxID=1758121 RepID=A0A2I0UAN9_LIMLA|nr:hypothetical protein llap_6586 [Limosa lapponica baueri]